MFHALVSHNDDLRRLLEKGFAVAFDSNCLIVRDIPYLDAEGNLQTGVIVAKMEFLDQVHVSQTDHQIFFSGEHPYGVDGKSIPNLGGGKIQLPLTEACVDVVVQRSFSNKPVGTRKFNDFFDKIESYVNIISGPAMTQYNITPYTFRSVNEVYLNSVFKVHDTLTSRAEITGLSSKLKDEVIAIIGLGGTGAYILDLMVKTPVQEIRAFDPDSFFVHNAFRSPGKFDLSEFRKSKVEVYQSRYETFRTGLFFSKKFLDNTSHEDLCGVTFAFVAVDKGSARSEIYDLLISKKIPFIDVGMGLNKKKGPLNGMLRVTYYSAEDSQKLREQGLAELTESSDDEYRTNIQTAELNALNACLAVIKFKQLRGFYLEEIPNYHLLFEVCDLKIVGKSNVDEI